MTESTVTLLNEQINKELYSAYLYLEFSNFFNEEGLDGFENWYYVQAQEEMDHAMLMIQYLHNNDEKVVYEEVKKPAGNWKDILSVLKASYAHEKYITDSINQIYGCALKENDFRTTQFLDWFIKEQSEEETNASDLIKKLELFTEGEALYQLNQELASRTYTAPSLTL